MSGQLYPNELIRPMTLVFAKEYTEEALREAMFAKRIVALYDDTLAGDPKYINQLIDKSLEIRVINKAKGLIEICNNSDIKYQIQYGDYMYPVDLYRHQTVRLTLPKGTIVRFINCVIGYNKVIHRTIW